MKKYFSIICLVLLCGIANVVLAKAAAQNETPSASTNYRREADSLKALNEKLWVSIAEKLRENESINTTIRRVVPLVNIDQAVTRRMTDTIPRLILQIDTSCIRMRNIDSAYNAVKLSNFQDASSYSNFAQLVGNNNTCAERKLAELIRLKGVQEQFLVPIFTAIPTKGWSTGKTKTIVDSVKKGKCYLEEHTVKTAIIGNAIFTKKTTYYKTKTVVPGGVTLDECITKIKIEYAVERNLRFIENPVFKCPNCNPIATGLDSTNTTAQDTIDIRYYCGHYADSIDCNANCKEVDLSVLPAKGKYTINAYIRHEIAFTKKVRVTFGFSGTAGLSYRQNSINNPLFTGYDTSALRSKETPIAGWQFGGIVGLRAKRHMFYLEGQVMKQGFKAGNIRDVNLSTGFLGNTSMHTGEYHYWTSGVGLGYSYRTGSKKSGLATDLGIYYNRVMNHSYSLNAGGYTPNDLSNLSRNIFGIKAGLAYSYKINYAFEFKMGPTMYYNLTLLNAKATGNEVKSRFFNFGLTTTLLFL